MFSFFHTHDDFTIVEMIKIWSSYPSFVHSQMIQAAQMNQWLELLVMFVEMAPAPAV